MRRISRSDRHDSTATRSATARLSRPGRGGVSIIELLIVIAIMTILMSLFFPVLYMLRQSSLRTACENNLRQLGLAMGMYSDVHRGYQPFPPVEDQPTGWAVELLPFMEEIPLYNLIDPTRSISSPRNLAAVRNLPPMLFCPVVPTFNSTIPIVPTTHYLLVIDQEDRWRPKRHRNFRFKDVAEGARFPWCTSPEVSFEDANYEPPHLGTEAMFGF